MTGGVEETSPMVKYLDTDGLRRLTELLRQALAQKQDKSAAITMNQVDAAIRTAVTDAVEGAY